MLRLWLASWQKHDGVLSAEQVERLTSISPAQIDRELAPYRSAGRRRRIASSTLAAMQREVAMRSEPWAETAPGALEIDTVALCGGSMREWSLWNNLCGAQRRLLRKERQADGKVKRYHESRAATPYARLLAREDISAEQRNQLQVLRERHDPIEPKASIEAKLKGVYAQRAKLRAEEEGEQDEEPVATPTSKRENDRPERASAG